jgi:hypothetical protein
VLKEVLEDDVGVRALRPKKAADFPRRRARSSHYRDHSEDAATLGIHPRLPRGFKGKRTAEEVEEAPGGSAVLVPVDALAAASALNKGEV